jgi:hypothetical protein
MIQRRRLYSIVLCVVFVLPQISCSSLKTRASYYSGEGEIKIVKMSFFEPDGYTLELPAVKLDKPVHLTYHLKHLPKISGHKTEVYFGIKDSRYWTDGGYIEWARMHHSPEERKDMASLDDLVGNMSMRLQDMNGNVIFNFNEKLSKYRWSRSNHGPYLLYEGDFKGMFENLRTEYVLEIDVDYDPMLKEDKGFVWLRCGGFR